MLASTVLAVAFVPVFFVLIGKLQGWLQARRGAAPGAGIALSEPADQQGASS
jgi:hypothetical protein